MVNFLLRRLLQSLAVLLLMSFIVFVGVFAIGSPVDVLIDPEATAAEYEAAVRALGLDKPWYEQYFIFLGNVLDGSLGNSFVYNEPALDLILSKMPATIELALTAMVIAIACGIPLGLLAGLKPGTWIERAIMSSSILFFSLPTFWVGLMLIMGFSVYLDILPSGGRGETVDLFGVPVSFLSFDGLSHLALPAINLAMFKLALVMRLIRAGVRENMLADYVAFARAKGVNERRIVSVHVLRNILIPVVTVLGLELGNVIAFAVVTESIFAWPGMGKLLIDSIAVLDRPIIVAYLLVTVTMFIVINLVVDLLYSALDPRIRLEDIKS
ncbi:ABC transporter permease [Magnetospira sp. QH-2]|uniref:ABC transporter permease n=1 Tax=Magnetospira sp. (strain QH-2) TaxID=1288970 RepID=UPI0005FA423D|nr:ABC transporter permease [Magnetospira sp. QH-2]